MERLWCVCCSAVGVFIAIAGAVTVRGQWLPEAGRRIIKIIRRMLDQVLSTPVMAAQIGRTEQVGK